jgi:glycosyltransferase domain-containing protein
MIIESRYTLVIPTYNRPDDLARQLRFLAHQKAAFPVLVLDSSSDDVHQKNLQNAQGLALDLKLERFDPATPPFEKFLRGAEMVRTEFASLCADDDFVIVSSIDPLLRFLADKPDYSVAHGWYFQFYLEGGLGLTKILYRSSSIDAADPLDRLYGLFSNYEALTYGVHRTVVLRRVLYHVQSLQSMLGRELLGGALAVIAGKSARLPLLYSGRSLGPSAPYVNWHPVDFLITGPRALYEEYVRYRATLLEYFRECGHPVSDLEAWSKLIDLVHLRYASEYFKPKVMDYLYEQSRLGRPRQDIMQAVWPLLIGGPAVENPDPVADEPPGWLERALARLRGPEVAKKANLFRTVLSAEASGANREVHVYPEFETALGEGRIQTSADELSRLLAGYA